MYRVMYSIIASILKYILLVKSRCLVYPFTFSYSYILYGSTCWEMRGETGQKLSCDLMRVSGTQSPGLPLLVSVMSMAMKYPLIKLMASSFFTLNAFPFIITPSYSSWINLDQSMSGRCSYLGLQAMVDHDLRKIIGFLGPGIPSLRQFRPIPNILGAA